MEHVHIEANNSTVVVGCSGSVNAGTPLSELDLELLRVFRSLPTRKKVELLNTAYELEK